MLKSSLSIRLCHDEVVQGISMTLTTSGKSCETQIKVPQRPPPFQACLKLQRQGLHPCVCWAVQTAEFAHQARAGSLGPCWKPVRGPRRQQLQRLSLQYSTWTDQQVKTFIQYSDLTLNKPAPFLPDVKTTALFRGEDSRRQSRRDLRPLRGKGRNGLVLVAGRNSETCKCWHVDRMVLPEYNPAKQTCGALEHHCHHVNHFERYRHMAVS